jgi:hypothetical protein
MRCWILYPYNTFVVLYYYIRFLPVHVSTCIGHLQVILNRYEDFGFLWYLRDVCVCMVCVCGVCVWCVCGGVCVCGVCVVCWCVCVCVGVCVWCVCGVCVWCGVWCGVCVCVHKQFSCKHNKKNQSPYYGLE